MEERRMTPYYKTKKIKKYGKTYGKGYTKVPRQIMRHVSGYDSICMQKATFVGDILFNPLPAAPTSMLFLVAWGNTVA